MGALSDDEYTDHAAWFGAELPLRPEMFKRRGL
jgi:hypothetical protein